MGREAHYPMAASSTALKAALLVEVNKIKDALPLAEATYTLDRYIDALDQQNALEAGAIDSYSIAGRSVTRRNAASGQAVVDALRARLNQMIYGSVTMMDMNVGVAEPDETSSY